MTTTHAKPTTIEATRRTLLTGSVALAAVGATAAIGLPRPAIAQSGKAKIVARYGHDSGPTSGVQLMGEYFAGRLAQLTDGEVVVQIYPNSQLGSTVEMTQAVRQGTLDFAFPTAELAGSVITPELGVLGLPYLIKSWEQATRIEFSQAADLLRERAQKKGVRILAFGPNALRNIFYNARADKLITQVNDVEGMKIRVLESRIDVAEWKVCGALPTPIPFGEVYTAMQQHVVDAVDNAFDSAAGIHLEDVINAVSLTNHRYEIDLFITNEAWFTGLPKKVQGAMRTAAREGSIYQQGVVMMDDIKLPRLWAKAKKVRTTVPDRGGFIKKMTSIYPQFAFKYGSEVLDLVQKV